MLPLLLSFLLIFPLIYGDIQVSCVVGKSCILPCSFQGSNISIIKWTKVKGATTVHFYNNKGQNQSFRGRTSLFKEQISRGNASLLLTEVKVQDEGRYQCYTSTISGERSHSSINLKVDAPVGEVDIKQVGNRNTWSTSPPSNMTFNNLPTVQQTEQHPVSDVTDPVNTHGNDNKTTIRPGNSTNEGIIIGVFTALLALAAVCLVICCKRRRGRRGNRNDEAPQDGERGNTDEEIPLENGGTSADKHLGNGRRKKEEEDSNGRDESQEMMETTNL